METQSAPRDATGETLVLVGCIVAIVLGILSVLMVLMMLFVFSIIDEAAQSRGAPSFFGLAAGPMLAVMGVLVALQAAGIVLGFQGRTRTAAGDPGSGWVRALVGGCLLVVGNVIAGGLMIAGAVSMKSDMDRRGTPRAGT